MALPPIDFVGLRRAREAAEAAEHEKKIATPPKPLQRAIRVDPQAPGLPSGLTRIMKPAVARGFRVEVKYAHGWYLHDYPPVVTGPHESLLLRARCGEFGFNAEWELRDGAEAWKSRAAVRYRIVDRRPTFERIGAKPLAAWIKLFPEVEDG